MGTWMAAIGQKVLEKAWKEQQQEVKVNVEGVWGGSTKKQMLLF